MHSLPALLPLKQMVVTDYDSGTVFENGVELSDATVNQMDSEWATIMSRIDALQESTDTDQPLSQGLQTAYTQASPTTPVCAKFVRVDGHK